MSRNAFAQMEYEYNEREARLEEIRQQMRDRKSVV
jgi:hypothetical protein